MLDEAALVVGDGDSVEGRARGTTRPEDFLVYGNIGFPMIRAHYFVTSKHGFSLLHCCKR